MKEDLLQYIWKTKAIPFSNILTTKGESLEIINFGKHNHDEGPDFLEARIKIDKVEFAGSIEIHLKASDWNAHNHSINDHYNNVILHVVMNPDVEILYQNGKAIPVFDVSKHVSEHLIERFEKLMHSHTPIPCQSQLPSIDAFTISMLKERMLIERLEDKSNAIYERLAINKGNWEETTYQLLFGFAAMGVNKLAFIEIAERTPFLALKKMGEDVFKIEATLFGQANLLIDTPDSYAMELASEYSHQKNKFSLNEYQGKLKFGKMRPTNFPTIRLAQLANLISKNDTLLRAIIEAGNYVQLQKVFKSSISNYWSEHYMLGRKSSKINRGFGNQLIDTLIINVAMPIMFAYGEKTGKEELKQNALKCLSEMKSENNRIVRQWKDVNVDVKSAFDSQALIQLSNTYCNHKKCLNCAIGNKLIR